MPETVVIRPAASADRDALVRLITSVFSAQEGVEIDEAKQRRGLELMLNNGRGCILTACAADGTVVGMCSGQLTISMVEGGPAVLIEDVVVLEDWRGQGIGGRLMDGMTEWASVAKATRLEFLPDNNTVSSLDFYRHLGWESTQLICLRNRP